MWPFAVYVSPRLLNICSNSSRLQALSRRLYSDSLESRYSYTEKEKIIQIINESDAESISRYDITKARLKQFSQWKTNNGSIKTLSDVHLIDGISERMAKKLFDSILKGPVEVKTKISNRIKGQILQPNLSPAAVKNCKSVLTVYITVSSVSWTLINKENYEVLEWKYHGINYPDGKKFQITDILDISWTITNKLPSADIYVMKAEATTLRAAGNDPNNPKVLAVNLQRAQMVSMIVALINARDHAPSIEDLGENTDTNDKLQHKVYFLRPSLPYRLYGTLVGNERVSTDQTVEILLQNLEKSTNHSCVNVPEDLINMFRTQKDLEKDMLGHCLLLSLTFMDLCIYKNQERIAMLLKRGE